MKKKRLSKSQIICIVLLWAALCYIVITSVENFDGPTIISLVMATVLIFIPVYKTLFDKKDT